MENDNLKAIKVVTLNKVHVGSISISYDPRSSIQFGEKIESSPANSSDIRGKLLQLQFETWVNE